MPVMVKLAANPAYKPTDATKADYALVKKQGEQSVDYVTAMENIQNSSGMYAIVPESPVAPSPMAPRALDDMDLSELKVMMLSLGVKTEKQMKKSDVIRLIKSKMEEIDIVEDEA